MRALRRVAIYSATLALAASVAAVISPTTASAHGTMQRPGSRTYLCWQDGLSPQGNIQPINPACAAAVAQSGDNSLYNWFSVLRSDANGRTVGYIPDGQLCSGGNTGFSGYNLARTDWPLTHLTSGASFSWRYSNWAHHPGTFYMYVTNNNWSPTRPLAWSDLESQPFLTITNPPQNGGPGTNNGHYYWNGNLPSGKSGRHIIYSRWVRSDSAENFFACSDVVFDGGNGEVTGVGRGNGSTPPPGPSTPPPGPSTPPPGPSTPPPGGPTTTPPPAGGGSCTASYALTGSWPGGFQAEVTVRATTPLNGWTVRWTYANGQTIGNLWNGTHTVSGSSVTVRNANWNGTLSANSTATIGLTGSVSGTNSIPALTCG
jgi:predicted carbohydrate-binding protein with CBM5 and CBM33 domain